MCNVACEYCKSVTGCDCVDRISCEHAGSFGHKQCGMCDTCNKPRFLCNCDLWHAELDAKMGAVSFEIEMNEALGPAYEPGIEENKYEKVITGMMKKYSLTRDQIDKYLHDNSEPDFHDLEDDNIVVDFDPHQPMMQM